MIVRAAPPEHYPWLIERVGCAITAGFRAIEAVDGRGRIHAMVGYDWWTETLVVMHVALDSPAALRSIVGPGFSYPFIQAGRETAAATVRASNRRSMRLCQRLGFREGWRIRDGAARGDDLVFFEMRKGDCRWIRPARKAA